MFEFSFRIILLLILCLFFAACSGKSDVENSQGTVSVQIPLQDSASSYSLKTVDLFEISNLREVTGSFARFYYAPGTENASLSGGSPVAHFIKSGSKFIPANLLSTQMASIYYHMQKLAAFDSSIGAAGINQWPRAIGLETRILENEVTKKNNAFYDGYTDSMMFVPFTSNDLPIALNAGIIAHEHFHSLFYKLVIKSAIANKKMLAGSASIHADEIKILNSKETEFEHVQPQKLVVPKIVSEKKKALLINEVYLRGLNEGLADFWGWLYTDDAEFMKWSLPNYAQQRSLDMKAMLKGRFVTATRIDDAVEEAIQISEHPRLALIDYSYHIGTPHARFLKEWTILHAEDEKITLQEAKLKMAQQLIEYLKSLSVKIAKLEENEVIPAADLFEHFINKPIIDKKLSGKKCEFGVAYLNFQNADPEKWMSCSEKDNQTVIAKP